MSEDYEKASVVRKRLQGILKAAKDGEVLELRSVHVRDCDVVCVVVCVGGVFGGCVYARPEHACMAVEGLTRANPRHAVANWTSMPRWH